jgi:hypothetical protein
LGAFGNHSPGSKRAAHRTWLCFHEADSLDR